MQEIWKDIKGYEGLYQVSNLGRIKSLPRDTNNQYKNGLIMKPYNCLGYLKIQLRKNGNYKWFYVHRLVAEAFIHNPNNYPQVNHIDGNKLNNNVNNLEYCTQSHNIKEAYRLKIMKPRKIKVNQFDLQGNFIKQWHSIKEIELFYNCRHISDCCKGKRKTAKGFIWKYAN